MNGGGQRAERLLVQIFEVAFSRRMCCSRVASVRHESAAALRVGGLAGEAPGHLAHEFVARGDHAGVWPAVTGGTPKLCASIATMSASAGGFTMPSETPSAIAVDEQRVARRARFRRARRPARARRRNSAIAPRPRRFPSNDSALARRRSIWPDWVKPISWISQAEIARVGRAAPGDIRDAGIRAISTRVRPVSRSAMSTASVVAVEPSHIEALATSWPVSWHISV